MIAAKNINECFRIFDDHWSPKIAARVNDMALKVVKVQGEFTWHHHDHEDELFWIIKGTLTIDLPGDEIVLNAGDFVVIPKGQRHRPRAAEEVWLVLLEPVGTVNTGNAVDDPLTSDPSAQLPDN